MQDSSQLIDTLRLAPHPEGGWYRETWRAPPAAGGARSPGTAILFLLEAGQRSHWHRVDADELWLWHAGSPLDLFIAPTDAAMPSPIALGADIPAGEQPQLRVPAGQWQAAHARRGWALVSCVVVPGFDFAGFELAPPDWVPGPGG
ncbi:cupin domain-containing protein [Sphingomonas sp.]|uniref:cupin domain-containing protein n=1 Tax=Sphingomonas sp. TaxID=28214 RepID=UPI001EB0C01A|nr:cupin domain-containing protein [Sphingomonas sp.]MBX3593248.1 cupin domain-containing protein [Sphingomonas sp.]